MKIPLFGTQVSFLIAMLLGQAVNAQTDSCSSWGGFIDDNSTLSVAHEYVRARDAFCRATEFATSHKSAQTSAQDYGLSLGLFDDLVDFSFDGKTGNTENTSDFTAWRDKFCKSSATDIDRATQVETVARKFGDNALQAAKACYDSKTSGLKGSVVVSKDKTVVEILLRYEPVGNESAIVVNPARIVPSNAVSGCNPNDLFGGNPPVLGKARIVCTWDRTKSFALQISTQNAAQFSGVNLDADPPPVKGDVLQVRAFSADAKDNLPLSDPNNTDSERRTIWSQDFDPKGQLSRFRALINATAIVGVSGQGTGPNHCSGNVVDTDPWRAATLTLRCAGKASVPEYVRAQEDHLSSKALRYRFDLNCGVSSGPVTVSLDATPRGCSAVNSVAIDGKLVEIKN